MPTNVPDTARILSPSGVVIDPAHVLMGVNGTNVSSGQVSQPVPGMLVSAMRIGRFSLYHIGTRGVIEADIAAGVAGTARMVAALTKAVGDSSFSVQLTLDTSNRVAATIVSHGSTVASWTAGGAAVAIGTPMHICLRWDAAQASFDGLHAELTLNGSVPGGSWGTSPSSPWVVQPLQNLQVGFAATWGDFNGTLNLVQVGDRI